VELHVLFTSVLVGRQLSASSISHLPFVEELVVTTGQVMGVPHSWSRCLVPVKILSSALNLLSAYSLVKCHFDLSRFFFSFYSASALFQIMFSPAFLLQPHLLLAAASQFPICSKSRAAFQTASSYPGSTISQTLLQIYKQSYYLPNAVAYAENTIITFVSIISSNAFEVSIF